MSAIICTVCGKSFDPKLTEAMPFCSDRCRQIDLGRWFNEEYSLPHESSDDEEAPRDDEDEKQ